MNKKWRNNISEKEDVTETNNSTEEIQIDKSKTNHVFFYCDVERIGALKINKILQNKCDELMTIAIRNGFEKPKLYLHINSPGGCIFSGISIMDTILRLKNDIDIITVVEGGVASAGTFVSIVGTKRWMTSNSYMLIHQLSSSFTGKYREIIDDMKNNDELMKLIKNIYGKYSKVPPSEIDGILEHDLWWDAKTCLKYKLIDKII